jgi:hypothetical protein
MMTVLRVTLAIVLAAAITLRAHDVERTQVLLTFATDGSFVLNVSNDANWLALRLESVPGPFIDRIVLWVDGREVRPETSELIGGSPLSTYRLRGHMPTESRTLRWFYGLVVDPYPLTIRRADGRIVVEEVAGTAWSREIDLSGQFRQEARWPLYAIAALFVAGAVMILGSRWNSKHTRDTTAQ